MNPNKGIVMADSLIGMKVAYMAKNESKYPSIQFSGHVVAVEWCDKAREFMLLISVSQKTSTGMKRVFRHAPAGACQEF